MLQSATAVAAATMIAVSCLAAIAQAAFLELPCALKVHLDHINSAMPALAPIETFIDWLEAAYGGPTGPDKPPCR